MRYLTIPICLLIAAFSFTISYLTDDETEDQLEAANSEPHPLYKDR